MNPSAPAESTRLAFPFPAALAITLMMAVIYIAIDMRQPGEPLQSLLAFAPGAVSLAALAAAGASRVELNLRLAGISRRGAMALTATTLLLLPILVSSTAFNGWRWLPAVVYAPASGIAQELYFRSALLAALERATAGRKSTALLIQAAIFVGFHARTFLAVGPAAPAILIAAVLFLAGCGWGWQVQRDRTVVWAMLQHSLFLMLMSMFDWG